MLSCPQCHNALPDDFGLVECATCGAQVFIEIDGHIRDARDQGASSEASASELAEPSGSSGVFADFEEVTSVLEEPPEGLSSTGLSLDGDRDKVVTEASGGIASGGAVPAEGASGLGETKELSLPEDDDYSSQGVVFSTAPEMRARVRPEATGGLEDLAQFINSDISSAREGSILYSISISGIDTVDLRKTLREALTDRLFMWDPDDLMRRLKGGTLVLEKVTPVKGSLLILRLMNLPVQIEWEQHVVSQL